MNWLDLNCRLAPAVTELSPSMRTLEARILLTLAITDSCLIAR